MTTLNPHYAPIALAVTLAFSRKRAMALGIPAALLLYLIARGPGVFSVDRLIARHYGC